VVFASGFAVTGEGVVVHGENRTMAVRTRRRATLKVLAMLAARIRSSSVLRHEMARRMPMQKARAKPRMQGR
jgi:hypothetical protein